MNALSTLFRGHSDVEMYMKRAKALKREEQIHSDEVKFLIRKLDGSLERVQQVGRRHKIPRSSFSVSEVTTCVSALRSMLFAMEILKRSQENVEMSEALREQARNKFCYSISRL